MTCTRTGTRGRARECDVTIDTTGSSDTFRRGELSEWSKVLDSKSSVPPKGTAGSNPALSAKQAAQVAQVARESRRRITS